MAFIVRQPNGKLARFSSVVDTVTHFNMTEEEYVKYRIQQAIEEARDVIERRLYPFEDIIDEFAPHNESYEQFISKLKEMGANEEQINYAKKRQEIYKHDLEMEEQDE